MAGAADKLLLLDRATRLLAEANQFEDLKNVRDMAEAARSFAKAARLGLELQNRAAELKLRAERKAGRFLADLHLRGGDRKSNGQKSCIKLIDLGVSRRQSELWQLAASVPEDEFEIYVRAHTQMGEELTASGLLRLAKARRRPKPAVASARRRQLRAQSPSAQRLEIQSLVQDLKSQSDHLTTLLIPFRDQQGPAYRDSERRFICRLAGEMAEEIDSLAALLSNLPG